MLSTPHLNIYSIATSNMYSVQIMYRAVAMGLAALAAFDGHFLDGKYLGAVEAMARSLDSFQIR